MKQEELEIDELFQAELARQLNLSRIDSFEETIVVEQESVANLERWKSID